jgi:hypothetical protein
MSSGKAKKREESALVTAANQSAANVARVDPLEERQRAHVLALDDWRMGKNGLPDVRNMPGGGAGISLFNEALTARDSGRVGKGYGTLGDGASANFSAALDKEQDFERRLRAAGQLEGHVSDTLSGLDQRMLGLSGVSDNRNRFLAEMAMSRLGQFYQRPEQPSFLKQLALGGLGAAGGLLSGIGGRSTPSHQSILGRTPLLGGFGSRV